MMKTYNDIVQSLDRGLQILDYLSTKDEYVSLAELTSYIRLNKSTVYRIMKTLLRKGYVRQDAETKKYSLGFRVFDLSRALSSILSLGKEAGPLLKELTEKTGESGHLAVLFEGMATLTGTENSSEVLAINSEVGRREPLYCTALGKVLLAYLGKKEFEDVISKCDIKRFTKNTITSAANLREELNKVRSCGYAIDDEASRIGVRCIAAPVYSADGTIVAAIGISGPGSRVTKGKLPELSKIVKKVGASLSSALGFSK